MKPRGTLKALLLKPQVQADESDWIRRCSDLSGVVVIKELLVKYAMILTLILTLITYLDSIEQYYYQKMS